MARQPRASSVFILLLTILGANVLAEYEHEDISPFAKHNIAIRLSLFATFVYFIIVVIYEILNYDDETLKIEKENLLLLGHIRFLAGTAAVALLILILIPYFGWLLLVIWIMFSVKIACYPGKTFYNFSMRKITRDKEEGQEKQQEEGKERVTSC